MPLLGVWGGREEEGVQGKGESEKSNREKRSEWIRKILVSGETAVL